MSSTRTEPRSIASQLVLLFTPASALLLCCGIGVLYWVVVRHAFAEDRAVLNEKVFAVRAELKAAGGPAMLDAQIKALRDGERTCLLGAGAGRRWERRGGNAGHGGVPARPDLPTDPDGRTHLPGKRLRRAAENFSRSSPRQLEAGGKSYTLQIAQDRTTDELFEKRFGLLVGAVLLVGMVASAALAVSVSKRGLRPLAAMTRSLMRVSPDRLDERVPPHEWPRELQPVAIAFDDMLDRLENSFNRLSQFSADLAHELRTPIAHIRGEAEVALTRPRSPNEYQAVIESSVAECERLSGLIDNLLFLARAEAAERQVHRQTFDARAAAEKIASYYEALAEERQVAITCGGEATIAADLLLFNRALSNLVENALRHTPAGGAIAIALAADPETTEVAVRDTGAGIAREHLPHVFDRFYRADPSRSVEGTGLGLALVKSIVELHGGTVAIASEVERGTTVTLKFPLLAKASTQRSLVS